MQSSVIDTVIFQNRECISPKTEGRTPTSGNMQIVKVQKGIMVKVITQIPIGVMRKGIIRMGITRKGIIMQI